MKSRFALIPVALISALSLSAGGESASSIVLGGGNAGTANVTISGPANH
mgnify:CR=1 FL=1